ncbi:MAG TPA: hypothetical protein VMW18_14440 [Candidatus Binatia bacterium]|nr:hypothetical protein [Candidatus Binatia bacterium]
MRRYVTTIIGMLALLLALGAGISARGLDQCPLTDRKVCGLFHFQAAKLDAAPAHIGILLLGDSALGNAVDAAALAKLSGKSTLNLALTGALMGLPAIDAQLETALKRHQVDNVVIMLSPESYRHGFEHAAEGYVLATGSDPGAWLAVSPSVAFGATAALVPMLFDDRVFAQGLHRTLAGATDPGDCPGCAAWDYAPQNPSGTLNPDEIRRWSKPYDDYDIFLKRIGDACRKAGATCLYSHGPILKEALDLNPDYVPAIDAKVTKAGLALVDPQPMILPREEAGDAMNHVRPDLRPEYTARFYRLLAPLLR